MFSEKLKPPSERPSLQNMCDEIQKMGDILACYAINKDGKLLGASYGPIVMDDKLRQDFNHLAAGVWSDLERVTATGGELLLVSITYENFKILGFPIKGSNAAVLLTIETRLDDQIIKERVKDFVSYWLKVNHYIE
jgi:hypothetical protein